MSQNLVKYYRQNFGAFNIDDVTKNSDGCVLHLKADANLYKANGDPVSDGDSVIKWDSQAQKNYDFMYQIYAPSAPIYHTNALNGLPIVSFTKEAHQSMYSTQDRTKFNIVTPSIFCVSKWYSGAASGTGMLFGKCGGTLGGNSQSWYKLALLVTDSGSKVLWDAGANNQGGEGKIVASMTDWNILSPIVHHEKSIIININGVDNIAPVTVNRKNNMFFNPQPFMIGDGFLTGFFWSTMDLAELIVLNYSAPDWLKQQIINYLSVKWGIAVTNTVPAEIPSRDAYVTRPSL